MHIFEGFRKNINRIFTAWLVFNRQINEIITPIFNIDLIDLLFENINDKKTTQIIFREYNLALESSIYIFHILLRIIYIIYYMFNRI